MLGETGNLVVKVDVKKNVEEGPTMANTELLEVWVSLGKANSVSGKTNGVIQVSSGSPTMNGSWYGDQGGGFGVASEQPRGRGWRKLLPGMNPQEMMMRRMVKTRKRGR
jgi:hypothetical protein